MDLNPQTTLWVTRDKQNRTTIARISDQTARCCSPLRLERVDDPPNVKLKRSSSAASVQWESGVVDLVVYRMDAGQVITRQNSMMLGDNRPCFVWWRHIFLASCDYYDPQHLRSCRFLLDNGSEEPPESGSSMYLPPLRPQLYQQGPTPNARQSLWRVTRTPLRMALLPLAAIGYLAFCYAVHGKVVPVNTYGVYSVTTQHLATIKGAITSISIVIISIALYPIYDVLNSLKGTFQSEEFFRVLSSHSHGVPLETINHISSPSFGTIDTMIAFWRRTCSNHYSMGFVVSLLVWVVATLAPGALTIDSVLADGEMVAFAIGAVPPQGVLNGSYHSEVAWNVLSYSEMAASIAWAEIELGVQYSFEIVKTSDPDYLAYIAPIPLNLSTTTSARWLTDVIGINPSCSWAITNMTRPVNLTSYTSFATAYLSDFNLDLQLSNGDIRSIDSTPFASVKGSGVLNHTTQAPAIDGSTVFTLGQCLSGCSPSAPVNFALDLTGLPTFTAEVSNKTWSIAVLVCVPNVTIETRELRNEGHGLLDMQPRPMKRQLARQGNLHPVQTTSLFSVVTHSLTESAGSMLATDRSLYSQLGSQVQGAVLYGKQQWDGLPGNTAPNGTNVTITLAPLEDITRGYAQIIQSAAKCGYLGMAYVPGRVSTTEIIFSSSIPNVVVSTVIFSILTVLIVLAQFRPASAQFAQMKAEQMADFVPSVMGDHKDVQQDIAEMLRERKIFLQRRPDGSGVLRIS
ncbi:hypothetical protein BU15DRAFT_66531 [Melanogaster broomeanus]|nr:hypothetical protein BU15DRAFT_66531 [Melanogaster broomeanus]